MCIYCDTHNYRKIYENHYGPIPKDENGRTYDIHHIDGNRKNNIPENLKAVSIQEHYDIHYSQEEWGACWLISRKMNLTVEDLANLSRLTQQQRIENRTHHFLKRDDGTSLGAEAVRNLTASGKNPFTGGDIQRKTNKKRVEEGTHHFLNGDIQRTAQQKLVKEGKHHLQGDGSFQRNVQHKRILDGTHHLLSANRKRVTCPHCEKTGTVNNMKRYHFDKCKYIDKK